MQLARRAQRISADSNALASGAARDLTAPIASGPDRVMADLTISARPDLPVLGSLTGID